MTNTLKKIKQLIAEGDLKISAHGYDELANDNLTVREIVSGVKQAILIEDYPDFPKGASVLVLQTCSDDTPVHVVWGIPKKHLSPAVLITAYRPDPKRWDAAFKERKNENR